jgi:hypothetical protein
MTELRTVAVLYCDPRGVYPTLPGTDCWPEARDARLYSGPHPVVAHPPCARWCRLAKFVEHQTDGRIVVGDDGGCFASALASVRRWGGVLEHPAWSLAWAAHGLIAPPASGWQRDIYGGWCCEVAQSTYGHRARKLTWLYYVGEKVPPELDWLKPQGLKVVTSHNAVRGSLDNGRGLTAREASATPPVFAERLLSIARMAVLA